MSPSFTSHFNQNISRVGHYLLIESLNSHVRESIKVMIK
jgi:hypothetical protein